MYYLRLVTETASPWDSVIMQKSSCIHFPPVVLKGNIRLISIFRLLSYMTSNCARAVSESSTPKSFNADLELPA